MKRCSISYRIRELPIWATTRYQYTPISMAKVQNTDNTHPVVGGNAKMVVILEDTGSFLKN